MTDPERAEIERLRAENASLNEQVKLLVQTEQRLYRSRNEIDQQMSRMRALANFAFRCSSTKDAAAILDDAAELLRIAYDVDLIVSSFPDEEDPAVWRLVQHGAADTPARRLFVSEGLCAWAKRTPAVVLAPDPSATTSLAPLRELEIDASLEIVGSLALRSRRERPAALLILARRLGRTKSHYKESLGGKHAPFLTVFARHVEAAMAAALLTERLRERSEELEESLTRLESAQQQLFQAQRMEAVGRLAGGIAHDFNNLLTIILGRAELVLCDLPEGASARRELQQIIDAGDRAAAITGRLLTFSRGRVDAPRVVDVNSLVMESARMLDSLIGDDVLLDLRLSPGIGRVRVDPEQLEQTLLNLVLNARDAMPSGGRITLITRDARPADLEGAEEELSATDCIAVSVADNGTGIDPEIRARIFEPYFTTKPPGRSSGLGLSMVYGHVRHAGGHVGVVSDLGRGSTFTLVLPVVTASAPTPESASDEFGDASATILFVEDEDGIRGFVSNALRREGYRVLEARDGAEALRVLQNEGAAPDLLVTDVIMPRVSGAELARSLRDRFPELPVLYISGYPADASGESHFDLEASELLAKPFTAAALLERVRTALGEPRFRDAPTESSTRR